MIILGIETSCDETAAAVVEDGAKTFSSVVFSQMDIHAKYGGVIPEIASRSHVQKILPVIEEAVERANVTPSQIDAVAVTVMPGLIGALLVGVSAAKGISLAWGKPLIGVNHLHAHLAAIELTEDKPEFPYVALLASGGHTQLYLCNSYDSRELIGTTLDDAAGEAFDKISKLLGLGYPGGAIIEKTAEAGDAKKHKYPIVMPEKLNFNFSFSGLKTFAATKLKQEGMPKDEGEMADFCASFQASIIENLSRKTFAAAKHYGVKNILVSGGVAANGAMRKSFSETAQKRGMNVWFPPKSLCGDNAAMVAAAGYQEAKLNKFSDLSITAMARFTLSAKEAL